MQNVTILIAVIAGLVIFFTKPIWSLVVYCVVMTYYPSYLSVPVGTIDFTASRIVILAVYTNIFFFRTNILKHFKTIWLDKLVVLYFICQILAGATNIPIGILLENRAGAVFDMVLPYFAVRMIVTSKEKYLTLLKGILMIAAPLALIGFYESLTAYNPMHILKRYCPWRSSFDLRLPNPRSGLYRAFFSFGHPIMFGLFFAMFGPVCAGLLRNVKANKFVYGTAVSLMALGVFSSMSSGPFMAALFAIAFIAVYKFREHSKTMFISVILFCLLVEIISNRHFFEVIDRFTLNSASAWYRSRLIEVALFEGGMSGHWITGYGLAEPGWGLIIDHRGFTDMVNHYLLVLSRYGLIGLVPFLALIAGATRKLIEAYRVAVLESDQWLIWCLAGGLFGVLAGMNSVSLSGQARTVFFIMLAFCAAMPTIVGQVNPELEYIR